MRIPTHMRFSRYGVYYFRIVVPKTVRPAFGDRREIKTSLGTRYLKVVLVSRQDGSPSRHTNRLQRLKA